MTTDIQLDDMVLLEAEAIVEAAWLRLLLDEPTVDAAVDDLLAVEPATRTATPRADASSPLDSPLHQVYPTQRSPPRAPAFHSKHVVE